MTKKSRLPTLSASRPRYPPRSCKRLMASATGPFSTRRQRCVRQRPSSPGSLEKSRVTDSTDARARARPEPGCDRRQCNDHEKRALLEGLELGLNLFAE